MWVGVSATCIISTKPRSLESAGRNQKTCKSLGESKSAWMQVVLWNLTVCWKQYGGPWLPRQEWTAGLVPTREPEAFTSTLPASHIHRFSASDDVTFLFKTNPEPPSPLGISCRFLAVAGKAFVVLFPPLSLAWLLSLLTSLCHCPSFHSAAASLAVMLVLKHCDLLFTSGPLHLLFPPPRKLFA